jgi:type VI secretion system secreted protein VgrG
MADEPRFLCNIAKSEFGVLAFTATESISAPYEVQLTLVTEKEVNFDDVVGKTALLTVKPDDTSHDKDAKRYFHGIINEFMKTRSKGRFFYYQATMVPSLWLLSLERDCRIFQNKTVPDIVGTILNEAGIKEKEHFSFRVKKGDYEPREYCVQYRETDLDFISRLLEEEGIFYFFEHTDQRHLLVFGDSTVNYKPIPGEPKVVFNPTGGMVVREESVYQFAFSRQIRSGKYTLRDFNFEKPTLDLTAQDKATSHQELEVYDYPGEYLEQAPGKRLAKIRLEESVMFKDLATGNSSCPRFTPCFTYKMTKHEHSQFNKEYLLIRMVHTGTQPQVLEELADSDSTFSYANEFSAVPSSVTFRPERDTPKPIVEGVHTAIVVGPKGEEIYTDKYGRVKVQFHWDRLGKRDENSSCWIRVSQGWAGGGWGGIYLPRIDQEVIVDFLEGDPDRPIITGRVYHGTNMPPYPLPDEKTKSTIMSNSSLGGGGFNELRFEDKKGQEEIYLHGQKDWTIAIENDKNQTVGQDETLQVVRNRSIKVGVDQAESIGANMSLNVGNNRSETVAVASTETVGAAKALTIGAAYQVTVGGAMNETVGAAKAEEIGGAKVVAVGAQSSESIGGDKSLDTGGDISENAGKNLTVRSGKKMSFQADDDYSVKGGKKGVVEMADELVLQCGEASITLKKNGDVLVKGKNINVKGSNDVILKGSTVKAN